MYREQGIAQDDFDLLDLGQFVVAPLVAKAFEKLNQVVEATPNPVILFPAREGWFLQKIWLFCASKGIFSEEVPTEYFYANRRAANRSHRILDDQFLPSIAKANFRGELGQFLESRLGLSGETIRGFLNALGLSPGDWVSLPSDEDLVIYVLKRIKDLANNFELIEDSRRYKNYLHKVINDRNPVFFDVGYSGTVVESIHRLIQQPIQGVFFQMNLSHNLNNDFRLGNIVSALTEPCYPDSPEALGNLGILLESVFRAPEKGFLSIDSQGLPVFDNTSEISDVDLNNLQIIIEGVKSGLTSIFTQSSMDDGLTTKLCNLVLLAGSTGAFTANRELIHALSLEDNYSGNTKVSAASL
jgi:hypothetical protein